MQWYLSKAPTKAKEWARCLSPWEPENGIGPRLSNLQITNFTSLNLLVPLTLLRTCATGFFLKTEKRPIYFVIVSKKEMTRLLISRSLSLVPRYHTFLPSEQMCLIPTAMSTAASGHLHLLKLYPRIQFHLWFLSRESRRSRVGCQDIIQLQRPLGDAPLLAPGRQSSPSSLTPIPRGAYIAHVTFFSWV